MENSMSWVDQVVHSVPEYAEYIGKTLESVINDSTLSEVDTHACAFVAAISTANPGLGEVIEFESPASRTPELEAAKAATALMGMYNTYHTFTEQSGIGELNELPDALELPLSATDKQFGMYSLAASIANKSAVTIKDQCEQLLKLGCTAKDLESIGKIAAVVSCIGKISL